MHFFEFCVSMEFMRSENLNNRLERFRANLEVGRVYRASELKKYSNSIARDLRLLVDRQKLKSLGKGLYFRPGKLGERELPARHTEVVKKFLKTNHFIIRNLSDFNRLGLGTTQIFKDILVYNSRRDGEVEIGGRIYFFKKKKFPKSHHDEYLFVDFFNNIQKIGEDKGDLLATFEKKWQARSWPVDYDVVYKFAQRYGKYWVKKYFQKLKRIDDVSTRA